MNNYEKILELAKNNKGYVTNKMVTNHKIDHKFLNNLVLKRELLKIERGVYVLLNTIVDEYYRLLLNNKSAVYSLSTALYFHGLSDRIPLILDITVPYNYSGNLAKNSSVRLNYSNNENLHLGVEEILIGNDLPIRVYNIEKTICDIIKHKDKLDAEIFVRALKKYVTLKNNDYSKLIRYAKRMNIEMRVRNYIEVLI